MTSTRRAIREEMTRGGMEDGGWRMEARGERGEVSRGGRRVSRGDHMIISAL